MKLTGRQILKISALMDKLEINLDPKADIEDQGSDLIMQVLKKAHNAEEEVAAVLAIVLECEPEEALDKDLMGKWEEFQKSDKGKQFLSFFRSAAVSEDQD